ncbi:MAG: TetR/AcrR family transcriptional regulator, partial [Gammaproteobacteria bacterium]
MAEAVAVSKRQRGVEATRRRLLDCAQSLFLEKGYNATSINNIVERAGCSKETVYRYFRNKEDILSAISEIEHGKFLETLSTFPENIPDAGQGLRNMAEILMSELLSPQRMALHGMMAVEAAESPQLGRLFYSSYTRRGYEHVEDFLRLLQERGDLKPVDTAHLAEYFIGMLLHKVSIERQCNVTAVLTGKALKKHAGRVVDDFIEAFGASLVSS